MRVLIFGGTGSIGQQCCEVCLQRHDKIVGISFFNNYVLANKIKTQYKFSPKHKKHNNVQSYQELIQKSRPDIIILAISNLETATRILKMVVDAKINVILANKEALILNAKEYQY
jgi:1-deoxy-D-xylulose 5-phosphate reductoisomerase